MKKRLIPITLLLTVPIVLVLVFDPASTLSLRIFLGNISGTIFFIDFPIGMCLLHYYYPQFFRHRKSGHYSLVPWGIFFLLSWGARGTGNVPWNAVRAVSWKRLFSCLCLPFRLDIYLVYNDSHWLNLPADSRNPETVPEKEENCWNRRLNILFK